MPRLKNLPSLDIIRGFKGIIDFYVRDGRAYARKWPHYPKSHQAAASRETAAIFATVLKQYHLMGAEPLAAFVEIAKDQPRTPRDVYVSAAYGNLHEVNMSDFEELLQACVTALQIIDNLPAALASVDTDALQTNVKSSALPTGAATDAKLDELIEALGEPGGHHETHEYTGDDELNLNKLGGAVGGFDFPINGMGSTITPGQKGHVHIPFPMEIERVTLLADQVGSVVVDIWKSTPAGFPPTDANSITADAPPTITNNDISEDTTLEGWTTTINTHDILAYNVDSCENIERLTVALKFTRLRG